MTMMVIDLSIFYKAGNKHFPFLSTMLSTAGLPEKFRTRSYLAIPKALRVLHDNSTDDWHKWQSTS